MLVYCRDLICEAAKLESCCPINVLFITLLFPIVSFRTLSRENGDQ